MSSSPTEYEAVVYFKIGMTGSAKDAVSSFVVKVTDETTISQFQEDLVNKLSKASLEVSAEFSEHLLQHIFDEMTRNNDEDQAEQ